MNRVLDFQHRLRLTPFAKNLLALPCMHLKNVPASATACPAREATGLAAEYLALRQAPQHEQFRLAALQGERLRVSRDEANPDVDASDDDAACGEAKPPQPAAFAEGVYATPSAYIVALVADLPEREKLTRDQ
eukprot:11211150-Lingulodinium_polyedra.AAC.1